MRPRVFDFFAGFGGASLGIEWALGRPVDHAINHSAAAIRAHEMNHPSTRHHIEDVFAVDPRKVDARHQIGMAWFSPDCFPAGTMILTRQGYRPIETVAVGDEVLTHHLRWRTVTGTMQSVKPVRKIAGRGHPGLIVSAEHPIYARLRTDKWNNSIRRYRRTWGDPEWVRASGLGKGFYWAAPARFPEAVAPEIPTSKNRRSLAVDERLMWLAGLYVADGWTRLTKTRADLVITCGHHETPARRQQLGLWPRQGDRCVSEEITWHERETRTAHQFSTSHLGLVRWLRENFGHGASEKFIPSWVLGLAPSMRQAFLNGYLDGDGCSIENAGNPVVMTTTVSKALAFGVRALAASLGHSPMIYFGSQNRNIIEGRTVNTKPYWSVRWRVPLDEKHREAFLEGGIEWGAIRTAEDIPGPPVPVYNLSVEGDESYVAEGVIVHNCTHHSVARGGRPREKNIRALAWITVRWAYHRRPGVMFLENVKEFKTWGPLDDDGKIIPEGKGTIFEAFKACLSTGLSADDPAWGEIRETIPDVPPEALRRGLGYVVEHKVLRACDYGAPTTRERFFMVMRCDGGAIRWPEPTHGDPASEAVATGRLKPWPTAADCINWTLPCYSIFLTREEVRAMGLRVKRPLAEKTMARIGRGTWRYVINARQPYLVIANHGGDGFRGQGVNEPMQTITGARDARGLVVPFLVPRYGEREGQQPRALSIDKPSPVVVPTGNGAALVAAFLSGVGGPEYAGKPTPIDRPNGTLLRENHKALVTSHLVKLRGTCKDGQSILEPMPTITGGGNHVGEVRAFLIKYYGQGCGAELTDPMHTITSKDRMGLVMTLGAVWQIVDIGLRMLVPREQARAQGFPDTFMLLGTQDEQVSMIGNSVPPQFAEALVRANYSEPRAAVVRTRRKVGVGA